MSSLRDDVTSWPPALPALDELEALAASHQLSLPGAYWITLETSAHVLNVVAHRDRHTGECLPQSLLGILERLDFCTVDSRRPYPCDPLFQAIELCVESLDSILQHSRSRIVREHVPQRIHALREVDTRSLSWIARLPGRSMREKLASKQRVLGVVRRGSPDTQENRAVCRVITALRDLIELREANADAYDVSESGEPRRQRLKEAMRICTTRFSQSALRDVSPSPAPLPNNVLISDRDYSRVWRAWQRLRSYGDHVEAIWGECEKRFQAALFWVVAARLHAISQSPCPDEVVRIGDGYLSNSLGLAALTDQSAEPAWQERTVQFVVLPRGRGRVKDVIARDEKPFGFLRTEEGNEYYFNAHSLCEGHRIEDLRPGQSAYFELGTPWGNMPPPAKWVEPVDPAFVRLRLLEHGVLLEFGELAGDGHLREIPGGTMEFCVSFDLSRELRPGRGTPFAVRKTGGGDAGDPMFADHADVAGMRALAGFVESQLQSRLRLASRPSVRSAESGPCGVRPSLPETAHIGLDLAGVKPGLCADGETMDTATRLYAVRYPLPKGAGDVWLTGTRNRTPTACATGSELISIQDVLNADSDIDQGSLTIAAQHMMDALAMELGVGSRATVAYAVPDSLDEFCQSPLRSAVSGAFGQALPIWRSVAAALAWQQTQEFRDSRIGAGYVVLVIDVEHEALTASFLVACKDRNLESQLPETKGIYWEHHPPMSSGESDSELTFTALCRQYLGDCLQCCPDPVPPEQADRVIHRCVATGAVDDPEGDPGPVFVQVDGAQRLRLHLDHESWRPVLRSWIRRFEQHVEQWERERTWPVFESHSEPTPHCRVLFVGRPFSSWEFSRSRRRQESALLACCRENRRWFDGYSVLPVDAVCRGAVCFLERRSKEALSWKEYLPSLSMEVPRNGLYEQLSLIGADSTGHVFGEKQTISLSRQEQFVLPKEQKELVFPLVSGSDGTRPMRFSARLSSPAFPLTQPVPTNLEIYYQYGAANPYELVFRPVDPSDAVFTELKAEWVSNKEVAERDGQVLIAPAYPRIQTWEESRPYRNPKNGRQGDLVKWLWGDADLLVRRCTEAFGGCRSRLDESMLREFERWFSSALEVPLRRLWSQGRTVSDDDAPEEVKGILLNGSGLFVRWLLNLCALDREWLPLSAHRAYPVMAQVRRRALMLLCRLHTDAPDMVAGRLIELLGLTLEKDLLGDEQARRDLRSYTDSAAHLLGDARGVRGELLNALLSVSQAATRSGRSGWIIRGEAIRSLAIAAWRHPGFIHVFSSREADLEQLMRQVESSVKRAVAGLEDLSHRQLGGVARDVRYAGEFLLALLRLRETEDRRLKRTLSSRIHRIQRIARHTRRIDTLLHGSGIRIYSSIDLDVSKPGELRNMSDLAYALNSYLTGQTGSELIHVRRVLDEDERETPGENYPGEARQAEDG